MKTLLLGASALVALASAAPASAATYIFNYAGSGFSATGTFNTSDTANANGGYLINSITNSTLTVGSATYAMTLLAPGTYPVLSGQPNDNLLLVGQVPLLDAFGFSFKYGSGLGTTYANIYYSNHYAYATGIAGIVGGRLTSFSITPNTVPGSVPEPASWAMLVSGFGLIGAGLRRRAVRTAVQAI